MSCPNPRPALSNVGSDLGYGLLSPSHIAKAPRGADRCAASAGRGDPRVAGRGVRAAAAGRWCALRDAQVVWDGAGCTGRARRVRPAGSGREIEAVGHGGVGPVARRRSRPQSDLRGLARPTTPALTGAHGPDHRPSPPPPRTRSPDRVEAADGPPAPNVGLAGGRARWGQRGLQALVHRPHSRWETGQELGRCRGDVPGQRDRGRAGRRQRRAGRHLASLRAGNPMPPTPRHESGRSSAKATPTRRPPTSQPRRRRTTGASCVLGSASVTASHRNLPSAQERHDARPRQPHACRFESRFESRASVGQDQRDGRVERHHFGLVFNEVAEF